MGTGNRRIRLGVLRGSYIRDRSEPGHVAIPARLLGT
jgi:hypothetical protein